MGKIYQVNKPKKVYMNNSFWHLNQKQYEGWKELLDNDKIPTH